MLIRMTEIAAGFAAFAAASALAACAATRRAVHHPRAAPRPRRRRPAARDGRELVDPRLRDVGPTCAAHAAAEARADVRYFAAQGYDVIVVAGPQSTAAAHGAGVDPVPTCPPRWRPYALRDRAPRSTRPVSQAAKSAAAARARTSSPARGRSPSRAAAPARRATRRPRRRLEAEVAGRGRSSSARSPRRAASVAIASTNERSILSSSTGRRLRYGQRRVAGAEVVDRELDAQLVQAREDRQRRAPGRR